MSNLVVQTNVLALTAHRNLTTVGAAQQQASARLSSGYKINSAADDAAGLAISETMRAQIRGLDMATKNAQDGQSMMQTAEGGLDQVDQMIQRVRELVVQSTNDTNYDTTLSNGTDTDATNPAVSAQLGNVSGSQGYTSVLAVNGDRGKIDIEIAQLTNEIFSMSSRVQFNHKVLLDGSLGVQGVSYQVGANTNELIGATQAFKAADITKIGSMLQSALGISGTGTGTSKAISSQIKLGTFTAGKASSTITLMLAKIDNVLTCITTARAMFGALENRLTYTQNSLQISSNNLSAAESRIKDTDMAKEMMNLTAANVLQQAGVSILSQANQAPQSILRLLQ